MTSIRFLSSNPNKIREVRDILDAVSVQIIAVSQKIEEIQTENVEALVKDKCVKAFHSVGRPIFVEHTSLHLSSLNGFPGGLTQVFWDTLKADKITELFGSPSNTGVIAKTRIGYCDGKIVRQFEGAVEGGIAESPRGPPDFEWDCVFVPNGQTRTFAEMGPDKNKISMRKRAMERFAKFLKEEQSD